MRFLVRHQGQKARIPTGITVSDAELTPKGTIKKKGEKYVMLERQRVKYQVALDRLTVQTSGKAITAADIVRHLTTTPQTLEFFSFADEYLAHSTIKGIKNYHTLLRSLESFLGERRLPFQRITYTLLQEYSRHLQSKPRAQSLYLGLLRHLFREAMRQYNSDVSQPITYDPFLQFRVPKQQQKQGVRSLTLDELIKIYQYQGRAGSRAQLARDCFILSFCLMGINSVDLYHCTTLHRGVLKYHRTKTKDRRSDGAYIEVRIHPLIESLVKRYRSVGARVFNFYQRYADETQFNRALNIGLKDIGSECGISNLQFYQARHTFATLSRNLMHFSKSDIDEALNHVSGQGLADIYIKKDFSVINDNNFRLIEKVFLTPNYRRYSFA